MRTNRHRFRVYFGDTDAMGIVYYANYLRYFEAGRSEMLRALGAPYGELEREGYSLPVTRAEVSYKRPARYDDLLSLDTHVVEVRHASFRIRYDLYRGEADEELIATGETEHACLGANGRVARLPRYLVDRLRPT